MPRLLRPVVVLLVISNVGLAWYSLYSIRALDRKYSELVSAAVPTLNQLQTLTAVSVEAMRSTNPAVLGSTPAAEVIQRARTAVERDRQLRHELLRDKWLGPQGSEHRTEFARAGDAFSAGITSLLDALPSAAPEEIARRRDENVRPLFDRYLAATTTLADAVNDESLQTNQRLTRHTGNVSRIVLTAGSWPFLAIVLIFAAMSVITLFFVTRTSFFAPNES